MGRFISKTGDGHIRKRSGSWMAYGMSEIQVREKLLDFQLRYQSYQDSWYVEFEHGRNGALRLMLVDRLFEPIRQPFSGTWRIKPDVPRFWLSLEESESGCTIAYQFRWLWWKKILLSLILLTYPADIILCIAAIMFKDFDSFILWLVILPLSIFAAVWLYQNYKHDMRTIDIFKELLIKNF